METKKIINSARDVLVGKVPDPKAQVEQITFAMFYKFMDEKDKEAVELGGKRQFFVGDFEKFSWTKLMDPRLGGIERMDLYTQALAKMYQNPHIAQLFRDIYKDAFIPFRSPETLNLFLKEIDQLDYTNTESLGDAFEYLLSVMGSQGDAGQFRTPRHIIDFMVEVVDPQKTDSILDPACGTAGFLISSYKHIIKAHDQKDDPENKEIPLTPDERKQLTRNLTGYDISPDMVRLSKVNMYLHGFSNPTIFEYDTLSDESKWDESFDVMLANPPFMSPKGGINPHKRFSIQANRSEVLFVDYIWEHLKANGRAGVIVPEGIVFQIPNAYKMLRKKIVEDGLFAVVSLPSGVFNPYAGVKTCILIFNKEVERQSGEILFVKIRNDGFGLGAQRRPISANDLPLASTILKKWKKGEKVNDPIATYVSKSKIEDDGNFILSSEHYREIAEYKNSKWPIIEMGEVADFVRGPFGSSIKRSVCVPKGDNTYKIYEQGNVIQNNFNRGEYYLDEERFKQLSRFELKSGDIVVTCAGTLGKTAIVPKNIEKGIINSVLMRIRTNDNKILKKYFLLMLKSSQIQSNIGDKATGVAIKNMFATSQLKKFKIPLPPLKEQEKIVIAFEKKNNNIKKFENRILELKEKMKREIDSIWKS